MYIILKFSTESQQPAEAGPQAATSSGSNVNRQHWSPNARCCTRTSDICRYCCSSAKASVSRRWSSPLASWAWVQCSWYCRLWRWSLLWRLQFLPPVHLQHEEMKCDKKKWTPTSFSMVFNLQNSFCFKKRKRYEDYTGRRAESWISGASMCGEGTMSSSSPSAHAIQSTDSSITCSILGFVATVEVRSPEVLDHCY